jgi:AraC-like DNA-binding protein
VVPYLAASRVDRVQSQTDVLGAAQTEPEVGDAPLCSSSVGATLEDEHVVGSGRLGLYEVIALKDGYHAENGLVELEGARLTELISGHFDFGDALIGEILDDLPDLLVVGGESMRLEGLARLLATEASGTAPGRKLAMDRLSDLLFIALLRHLMERGAISHGLLAGLGDARISQALAAMHADPAAGWTLQSLAEHAGMSRTSFAQQFRRLMGTTPLRWLMRLRMDKAQALLASGRRPVGSVAADVGYGSEAAFRRAFARWRKTRIARPATRESRARLSE